jgi:hypothetical protein
MADRSQSQSNRDATGNAPSARLDRSRDQTWNTVEQVRQAAKDVASRGVRLAGEAKDKALDVAEGGRDQLADRLDDFAGAVERSGMALEGQQDWLAGLVERGAEELGGLASTVRSNDLRGLLGKLEGMARRQPVLFAGAAMAAGFASARLGKAALTADREQGDGRN